MRQRFRTWWVVLAFLVIGALVAVWLIVRGVSTGPDVSEEDGTTPAAVEAVELARLRY